MRRFSVVFALLLALSLFAPTVSAQETSPVASPAMGECIAPDIPPGTPTPMEEEGTPEAEMGATPEEEEMLPEASPEIPVGDPAPDDVVADVEAALENFVNCFNGGDFVAVASLYTEAGLMSECFTTNVYDGPMCFGGLPPVSNVVVSDVQVHDDGRVSADVTYQLGSIAGHERFVFVVDDQGMYLIDTTPDLPVAIPEGATVIEGELADFEFILDETSAPAGDIAITATNTGEYPHEILMLRLPEGVTAENLLEDESLFEQVEFFGFAFAEPGQETSFVALDMEPGTYTLVCFVDVPEGVPHVMRGMVLDFEITAP